jgi:hypothetical protein
LAGGRKEEQLFLNLRRELVELQDLTEPGGASMRRPLLSTENCLSPKKKGDSQGGLAPLVGEPAFFSGVGGTHPAKRPLGDREGGVTFLFL